MPAALPADACTPTPSGGGAGRWSACLPCLPSACLPVPTSARGKLLRPNPAQALSQPLRCGPGLTTLKEDLAMVLPALVLVHGGGFAADWSGAHHRYDPQRGAGTKGARC